MPHQTSERALLSFQDVVVHFSQEEQELLQNWQKDLYANIMKEIHQVLMSLGPVIANTVFSLRLNEKGRFPVDFEDFDRRLDDDYSPNVAVPTSDVFTLSGDCIQCSIVPMNTTRMESPYSGHINRSENSAMIGNEGGESPDPISTGRRESPDPPGSDRRENYDLLSTGKEKTTGIISESIKEEGDVYPLTDQNHEVVRNVFWPAGFIPPTSEPEDIFLNPVDEDGRDGGVPMSTGMAVTTSIISSEIKEEAVASSVEHPEFEKKGRVNNPTVQQSGTGSMKDKDCHRYSLRKHVRTYNSERHFTCTECNKRVNEKSLLESHQRNHPELRPYRCTECEIISARKSSRPTQEKLQTGVKRYHCNACEKGFTQKQNLQTHQRIHTGFREFHCTVCDKNFTQKVHLLIHQRTHTGERPYHCRECEKSFTQKPHLLKHQRTHSGVRPFHCTMCEKSFTQKCNLQKHLGVHTGVKPFTAMNVKSGLLPKQPLNVT
ncbi:uncharacterized protein LOC144772247 [Lissotriton helveticus]